jgi:biopolymer transport protein ExbB
MRIGIENRIHDTRLIKELILEGASQEIPALEKFLSSLGTIAHVAPLLGLLGTVTGNIRAFGILGSFGAVGDPSLLAKGISEALLTTAAGIIVAIPTLAFYNYLVGKVNHLIIRMENRVNEMILILKGGGE